LWYLSDETSFLSFQLHICLPDRAVVEGQLLFVSKYYDIALLEISSESDLPLQTLSFGSNPNYGQEVFMLGRGKGSNLVARHGKILWFEDPDGLVRNYHMFLNCEPPKVLIALLFPSTVFSLHRTV
jgi:hypothetical protein